ncbi:glutathione hydrolase 5 proenzyme-like [Cyprinodon tularosa]|uniref:glutathione hydrolase 5 proenzyme-like n=1 Tax=Cyprinodon tularosa TaxID=77115 RepID=UPI0018E23185|nr:glutathione hydrolase 5 proenzyme-like [Cyprinodon tularosa]
MEAMEGSLSSMTRRFTVKKSIICFIAVSTVVVFAVIIFSKNKHPSDFDICSEVSPKLRLLRSAESSRCPDGIFLKGAVAADSETCSVVGRDILKKGGSAVDAAIAALLCTSIVNPQSAGLGGGSIFTVMDSSGHVTIINSRETAPLNVISDLKTKCGEPPNKNGMYWIGVPGEIRGYEKAHKLFGKLPWADLFQWTIKRAREGIKVPRIQGCYIQKISENDSVRKAFTDEKGNLLKTGDIIKFEKLADTLETIADDGAEAFYSGRIAEDLVRDVQEAGGVLTLEDLASYKVKVTDAWNIFIGDYQMYIPPPPSGGVLLGIVLNIMKGCSWIQTSDLWILSMYKMKCSIKKMFETGECCVLVTYTNIYPRVHHVGRDAKKILDSSFAKEIWRKIKSNEGPKSQTKYEGGSGTTHLSVLDESGIAVSVTSSINAFFGSRVYSRNTGIILNNQLKDFCNITQNISPGERPPSSMAPSILKSKSNLLVIGGSGGKMITTGLASALLNLFWPGNSLKEAIDTPVLYVDPSEPNTTKLEYKFSMLSSCTPTEPSSHPISSFSHHLF